MDETDYDNSIEVKAIIGEGKEGNPTKSKA